MISALPAFFWPFCIFIFLFLTCGFYYLVFTTNLVRALIAIELLVKAVTFLIIFAGYVTGNTSFTQTLAITMIVIEVVVMVVGSGIILCLYRNNNSIDSESIRNLKG